MARGHALFLYPFNMFSFIQEDEDDILADMDWFLDVISGGHVLSQGVVARRSHSIQGLGKRIGFWRLQLGVSWSLSIFVRPEGLKANPNTRLSVISDDY